MAAALAAFPDRRSLPFNAADCPVEREQALWARFPEPLRAALKNGVVARRSRFGDDGFDDVIEEWTPPRAVGADQAAMAGRALEELRRDALAPSSPDRLLARVLALLSHYPAKGATPEVERMIALDWADDLGEFPAWAVDQAARAWRRTRKWRPSIAEMRALCLDACRRERALAERLARLAAAVQSDGRQSDDGRSAGARSRRIAATALRRMP